MPTSSAGSPPSPRVAPPSKERRGGGVWWWYAIGKKGRNWRVLSPSPLGDEPPVTYGARRHREARVRTPAARASRVPRATSRVIPATGKRSNPPPQQQQGRPHLRAQVRTRDVACAMTRRVPSARGARALLEQTDVPRSARQDEQREEAGGSPYRSHHPACVHVRTCGPGCGPKERPGRTFVAMTTLSGPALGRA